MVRFGFFRPEYSGSDLEVVHLFRLEYNYSDRNSPFRFLTNWCFALIREFGKGIKSGKSHFYWLTGFNRKMWFHYPQVFPLISHRSPLKALPSEHCLVFRPHSICLPRRAFWVNFNMAVLPNSKSKQHLVHTCIAGVVGMILITI